MTPIDFDTRAGFRDAVVTALHTAIERGARRIVGVDPDFADWPLDRLSLDATLSGWLRRPQRQLVLLASNFDAVPRHHPRFAAWRVDWMHAIDARLPAPDGPREWPTVLFDDGPVALEVWQRDPWRGRAGSDAATARKLRESVDAELQRSLPGWPARPLGL